jgi:hypothetical protein
MAAVLDAPAAPGLAPLEDGIIQRMVIVHPDRTSAPQWIGLRRRKVEALGCFAAGRRRLATCPVVLSGFAVIVRECPCYYHTAVGLARTTGPYFVVGN